MLIMFGLFGGGAVKQGDYVFATIDEGEYCSIIIGYVEFRHENRVKIKGTFIKPIGLLEKVRSGKGHPRFREVLRDPTPENMIHILLNKVDSEEFEDYFDMERFAKIIKIPMRRFTEIDYWVKEGFPELFAVMLSQDPRREEARQLFLSKLNSIYDQEIKKTVYAVARQLKII